MAYPVSGNYEARVGGTTTVKVAYADAIDAALNGIYGGTKTLTSLHLDGVGYQAASAGVREIRVTGGTGLVETTAGSLTVRAAGAGTDLLLQAPAGRTVFSNRQFTCSAGNITASAGNVEAAGTPVGNAGPGLLKGKRLYSTGSSNIAGNFVNTGGWDTSTFAPAAKSTDMAGDVTITAGGGGLAANPIFTFTFTDGTFTNVPIAIVQFRDTNDPVITTVNSDVSYATTATTLQVTLHTGATVPTATKLFRFSWILIGN